MMLADASVLDVIAGKRVIGISSLAISVSSSGLMLLLEKLIFNKHWVHPVLYGPDLQFLPFSGHGHFGASATLSWVLVGKFGVKKVLLDSFFRIDCCFATHHLFVQYILSPHQSRFWTKIEMQLPKRG